jgi:NADPH:quinone reductase-like Zn-dependent oxidoreductase
MTTTSKMTCIEIAKPGDPDVLVPATRPKPKADFGEVVIKVAAVGVNGPDLMQRKGLYPPPKGASDLLGLEVAGTIAEIGDGVSNWWAYEWRRLCGVCGSQRQPLLANSSGSKRYQRSVFAGDLLYDLEQHLYDRQTVT